MNCAEANQIDLVEYLYALGFQPEKVRNNDYWYLSPLRNEKTASFKVNRVLNQWYDHGEGKGGNVVDFALLYHHCPLHETLQKLEHNFSFHQHKSLSQKPTNAGEKGHIEVMDVREIQAPELTAYLSQRKVSLTVAKSFCKEVDFVVYDKKHTAIALKNNSGGYELRNEYFKGSASPKDVTIINNNSENISVFEGMFSFLSFQTLHQNNSIALTNFLVLNSLSFLEKSRQVMEQHQQIKLYLDRDSAGLKHLQNALTWSKKYVDQSRLYQHHKDLNDYLIHRGEQHKQSQRLQRHL
ncbi:toprim domain-containing protein [Segetibacter sp.]|jgi:DNA primase|uniref:toprim domain-containing protein n=1 Tax=Segetibacter sp. TaxID=2231182 RepID=UPI0026269A4E|nr:toprim domain-containing protein [Segetibacter sp.]MCW3081707.1 zinc finger protein [Segetibacter sp.]